LAATVRRAIRQPSRTTTARRPMWAPPVGTARVGSPIRRAAHGASAGPRVHATTSSPPSASTTDTIRPCVDSRTGFAAGSMLRRRAHVPGIDSQLPASFFYRRAGHCSSASKGSNPSPPPGWGSTHRSSRRGNDVRIDSDARSSTGRGSHEPVGASTKDGGASSAQ